MNDPDYIHVADIIKTRGEGAFGVLDWHDGFLPFMARYPIGTKIYVVVPAVVQGPITYSVVGTLPPGVTLDPKTGKIHGNRQPKDRIVLCASDGMRSIEFDYPNHPAATDPNWRSS